MYINSQRLLRLWRHDRPFRMLVGCALIKSGLYRFVRFDYFGAKLRLSPNHLALRLWAYRQWRAEDVRVLRQWLREGDTYIDVGANIGSLAAVAACIVGDSGRVLAFEANPQTFSSLVANATPNMTCCCAALGERPGCVRISNKLADDQNSVGDDGQSVVMIRLDDITNVNPEIGMVRLLKIDVEGFELFVLRGALTTLKRTEVVYFEVSDDHFRKFGYRTSDAIDLLKSAGFRIAEVDGTQYGTPYRAELNSRGTRNLLAYRDLQ